LPLTKTPPLFTGFGALENLPKQAATKGLLLPRAAWMDHRVGVEPA
jgi:hypothetical protein